MLAMTSQQFGTLIAYSTLKGLCLPDLPADKTYDQLTQILKDYYKAKVLEVAETYRFHHNVQSETESVAEYANKLKRLAVHCNFGPYLTRALRDQFVGGVRSQTNEKKLLSGDSKFDQALKVRLKVAQADELAEKESKLLQGSSDTSSAGILPVTAVHKKSFPAQESQRQADPKLKMGGKQCFRCGLSNLHVITMRSLGIWLRHASRKRKNLMVKTPLTK